MEFGAQFHQVLRRFDDENARDPNLITIGGTVQPRELFYAQRLTEWVLRLCPEASEVLQLAARCQHICRWMIPRNSYPMTRAGYLRWREELKRFHAQKSSEILREAGYPGEMIARVRELNLKKNLGEDPECQVLEDALCLETLQYQLGDLMDKTEPDKMVAILQKTWKKMSPAARQEALGLSFSDREKELLSKTGIV
ncbi:MAG TPA: DUF4202 domain-containing protein [Chthoniobacterales bacterium]|nr:DUF4202 domain-containing protein [Chthoniobacterales bacterium]